jgi:hypothetical protein
MKSAAIRMMQDPMQGNKEPLKRLNYNEMKNMSNAFVIGNGVKHSSDLIRSSRWVINGSGRLQGVNTEDIVQFTDDKLIEHSEIRFHLCEP